MSDQERKPPRRPEPAQLAEAQLQLQERLQDAAATPWKYGFTALLRAIAAQQAGAAPGAAAGPQDEAFRLGQRPAMGFAPREIAAVELGPGPARIHLFGLGLLGPNGPLPIHVTEIARERLENRRDATLVDFLDLFHHRYLSQLYRAWAQGQAAAGLDRAAQEQFSHYVGRLAGIEALDSAHSPLPQHARLAAVPHLVQEARQPAALVATLAHYFGIAVGLQEYVLHWLEVAPQERSRLGRPAQSGMLGEGALLGAMVADRQHLFRLLLGPLSLQQYQGFLPDGEALPELLEWVRALTGFEYRWEIRLVLAADAVPQARLGADQRLGWTTWLACTGAQQNVTGVTFEPERQSARSWANHE